MRHRIVIQGAGIGGMAAAIQLGRSGHEVVVVDRVPRFEARGHFISLKGTGVHVLDELGVGTALRRFALATTDIRYLDRRGRTLRTMPLARIEEALGGFVFVRRAHLHQVLFDAVPADVELRWGSEVAELTDQGSSVLVSLQDGATLVADAVIGADGVHSSIRRQSFPDLRPVDLDGRYTVFEVTWDHPLGVHTHMAMLPGANVNLIPLAADRVGVVVYQDDGWPAPPRPSDPAAWRMHLLEAFAGQGSLLREAFAAVEATTEIFTDRILMVESSRLAEGRVALLGDAGSCPTFFSGMGSALALQAAYALARRMDGGDVPAALASYEAVVVPLARAYQRSARVSRRLVLGRGATSLVRNGFLRYTPTRMQVASARKEYRAELTLDRLR